jgi:LPPG:FO 2-phospho-L-lactate transferase
MKITALAGGIGASKFLVGLADVMPAEDITIIANTGDDVVLHGLRICPDVDTVTYTLAGIINESTGWGVAGDTFECLRQLGRYSAVTWFNLGDRDLAIHIYRTDQLRQGRSLTEVTDQIRRSLGVRAHILPMTDSYVPTRVVTDEGEMHIQEYFVRRRCEPRVKRIISDDVGTARPAPGVEEAIAGADAVIICPSNPFISIGPILSVPHVREALHATRARVAAITPIIAGQAIKGPAADMLRDLGHEVSALGVANLYCDVIDLFVVDRVDEPIKPAIEQLGVQVAVLNTVMVTLDDKRRLAREVLEQIA